MKNDSCTVEDAFKGAIRQCYAQYSRNKRKKLLNRNLKCRFFLPKFNVHNFIKSISNEY